MVQLKKNLLKDYLICQSNQMIIMFTALMKKIVYLFWRLNLKKLQRIQIISVKMDRYHCNYSS